MQAIDEKTYTESQIKEATDIVCQYMPHPFQIDGIFDNFKALIETEEKGKLIVAIMAIYETAFEYMFKELDIIDSTREYPDGMVKP